MRLMSYMVGGQRMIGVRYGDAVLDISELLPEASKSMLELLELGNDTLATVALRSEAPDMTRARRIVDVELLPVVPNPGKILCLGLNYIDHAAEAGLPVPKYPVVFLRTVRSLVAAGAHIAVPKVSDQFDYEAELAIVIGRGGRNIAREDALSHVAGYAIFNDITVRDYQMRGPQWTIGKNFDRTGALGPDLVTADSVSPGGDGLRIRTRINGITVQDGNTGDMIFKVPDIIASLTETMTLDPGDVIVTGTPAGVGGAHKPPLWLKAGDICEVEIESLGILANPIVTEDEYQALVAA